MTLDDYADLSAQKPEKKTEYTVLCRKMKTAQPLHVASPIR
jgi:hypothetical protein